MQYEFEVYQMNVDDHLFWVAKSKSLKGCVGQGDTSNEAIAELEENEKEWLATAKEYNVPIPPLSVRSDVNSSYSGKVSLRFSPIMHSEASEYAKKQGISLNQYINDAIAYYNGINSNFKKEEIPKETEYQYEQQSIIRFSDYSQNKSYKIKSEQEEM